MIYQSETDLAKDINQDKLKNLYLFYGSENYLIDLYCEKILKRVFKNKEQSYNFNKFSDKHIDLNILSESIEAMPLVSSKRVTMLNDPDAARLIASKDFEKIISDIPEYTILIIIVRDPDFNPAKNKSNQKLLELCDKYGSVCALNERTEAELIRFITAALKKRGKSISMENAKFLILRCFDNMDRLSGELAKLSSVSNSEITKEDIIDITVPTITARIYDLSKAVKAGSLSGALGIIDKLFYLREQPTVILSTLSYFFSDLYKAAISKQNGIAISDAAGIFSYRPNDFRIKNAFADCKDYDIKYLGEVISVLTKADFDLKNSRIEPRTVVERAVVEIFMLKDRK